MFPSWARHSLNHSSITLAGSSFCLISLHFRIIPQTMLLFSSNNIYLKTISQMLVYPYFWFGINNGNWSVFLSSYFNFNNYVYTKMIQAIGGFCILLEMLSYNNKLVKAYGFPFTESKFFLKLIIWFLVNVDLSGKFFLYPSGAFVQRIIKQGRASWRNRYHLKKEGVVPKVKGMSKFSLPYFLYYY